MIFCKLLTSTYDTIANDDKRKICKMSVIWNRNKLKLGFIDSQEYNRVLVIIKEN